jgi:6,7-dimethyl-8-ribityllumazine synthase
MATRKTDSLPALIEGSLLVPKGSQFAIVAARFNEFIVGELVGGARDALVRHGADPGSITVVRVPGAWEIPHACARLAKSKRFDAIIAVGAVIRGGTPHFDYVAGEVSKGVAHVGMDTGTIISFGVLTTDTIEQAVERAGTKAGNKGFDAAMAAIEMVSLGAELSRAGL